VINNSNAEATTPHPCQIPDSDFYNAMKESLPLEGQAEKRLNTFNGKASCRLKMAANITS
jgi:hypothetical protein